MTSEKTNDSEQKRNTRQPKPPKTPGTPKKKSAQQRNDAYQRQAKLEAARSNQNAAHRIVMETCLVRAWIDREFLVGESMLSDLMWVQYRYMSPLARTELFTQEYIAAYRRCYAKHCDPALAALKRPVEIPFARNALGDMNCLWRARATADALGVPYDMYLDAVMEGKLGNQKWVEPPQPNQLYGTIDPARLRDRPTPQEIAQRLYASDWDARFFASAYRGDPTQEAALSLLRADVLAADDKASRLSMYLTRRHAITEVRARAMFDNGLVDAAITIGGKSVPPSLPSDSDEYRPPCFGYPNWLETSLCLRCPVVRDCRKLVEDARASLVAITGNADPRLAIERAQTALRQRNWYAKHKGRRDAGDN